MTQTSTFPAPDARESAYLDCERLDCFHVAVEFQTLAADLCSQRRLGALRDQLRASVSIVQHVAAGTGHKGTLHDSRGAARCVAVLELRRSRPDAAIAMAAACWSAWSRC
jgi:hypothetical protein